MPKRLLLIAATTGYQTRTFAEAAARLGYEVQLATDRCNSLDDPWGDHAIALKFQLPEAAGELIAGSGQRFDGVLGMGDRPAVIAAVAAERLEIAFSSPAAVEACRNKHTARERFAAAGLPVPSYFQAKLEDGAESAARRAVYPCVLKPLGLSASRGVIRADDEASFRAAFERIGAILGTPEILRMKDEQDRWVQVEEFIPGREFAVEAVLTRGRLDVLAIFDKPDPLDGPFFEETIYVTPSRENEAVQGAIRDALARSVEAIGLTHGPVHAEMRVNPRGVWMLEVAARPIGGLCAQVLRFDDGSTLEELLCRHAVGDEIGSTRLADPARGVMMVPIPKPGVYVGVRGEAEARRVAGVESVEITAKEGQKLVQLPEGASYLGFIFSRGNSPADAEQALRLAHSHLRFEIAASLPVLKPVR
jgi:biotin carboxylase